ncbi:MAG: PEGA domain-containing protein [Candidatus Acidiferrales bacterium]
MTISSVPAGATIEIDGTAIGLTPYTIDYPSSYFHKPHTVFSSRLEHALILKVHKEGYTSQQITLTDGPLQWISVTGRRHGNYFLLKGDHFVFQLEQLSEASAKTPVSPPPGHSRAGAGSEQSGALMKASLEGAPTAASTVSFSSEPNGADIYIDGKFVGQTPATISVQPGPHVVLVKATGRKNWQRDLEVLKDSQVALRPVLELQPSSSAQP